jgi:uncharacterized protein (DUF58 family)
MPLKEFKAKLVPEIKELNIFIKKNLLSTALSGELISSLKGRGIEFEDYRDYSVEDDAGRIDWRASKRAQRTLVREYKLDVNFNAYFLIDVSESMLFASTSKLKCEYAAQAICSLFYGIIQTGNAVGFGLFNDRLVKMSKPMMGKKQFYNFTRVISDPKNYGGKKDMSSAIKQSLVLLDKRALVIIVSDFLFKDDSWLHFLKIMAQKHEVMGIVVRDPRDNTLPINGGQIIFSDIDSDERIYIDSKQYNQIYEEYGKKQMNLIRSVFKQNKLSLVELTTDVPYLNPLLQFFKTRGGRWR